MEPDDSDPDASSSPNKRQKTLDLTPSSSKGKEKIEHPQPDDSVDSATKVCGICFSEGEKSVRGLIDSCSHYFCFVCIMEWAKHESRCPLCKQRFKTIVRKPKHGVFLHERLVNVPVRNQVWHPLGIQTDEIPDPFAEVKCIECQSSSDEDLLLLCDLCDSASHTYCVGLGSTVPEGDWFCQDCTVSRNEHYNSESDTDSETPQDDVSRNQHYDFKYGTNSENPITVEGDESDVDSDAFEVDESVSASRNSNRSARRTASRAANSSTTKTGSRIANTSRGRTATRNANTSTRRTASRNVERSKRKTALKNRLRSSRRSSSGNVNISIGRISLIPDQLSSQVPRRDISSQTTVTDCSVRTLSHCRNVHNRIRVLRANWGAFRNGSVTFSTGLSNSAGNNSRETHSSSSMASKQSITKDNVSGDNVNAKNPYDINRAWKMLDIAKSVQQAREGPQSRHQASSHKPDNKDPLKVTSTTNPTLSTNKAVPLQPKDHRGFLPEKNHSLRSVEISQQKHKSPKVETGLLNKGSSKSSCSQRIPTNPSQSTELSSGKQTHMLDQVVRCQENTSDGSRAASNINGRGRGGNVGSLSQTEPSTKVSDIRYNRPEGCESSRPKEGGLDRNCGKLVQRKDEVAKCEVQSLVKLNLKLLSRDKPLGVNGFKEVARLATHTILAACGLEHKESNVRPYSDSICRHNDHTKKLHMSSLMPTSCRECFFAFVKDVVNSIVAEEL